MRHRGRCVLQVDRLEQDFSDVRREQEAQAATTAARVQTTGVLEEYRTRAQQALKRANEVTGQTASENKRLEVRGALRGVLARFPRPWYQYGFGNVASPCAALEPISLRGLQKFLELTVDLPQYPLITCVLLMPDETGGVGKAVC